MVLIEQRCKAHSIQREKAETMLKKMLAMAVCAGLTAQAAVAAPMGWYDLELNWRDGAFAGQIRYDGSSPYRVLKVNGTLTTTAQTTAIADVWNVSTATPVSADTPLNFTNWADPADALNYNAAFYLELADLGSTLGVLAAPGSAYGLYDWSSDALFDEDHLNNSPLLSWRLVAAPSDVPEPATFASVAAALIGCALARRRKRA